MDKQRLEQAVSNAMLETFEGMAFVELNPSTADEIVQARASGKWVNAKITLREPIVGEITMVIPREVGEAIAGALFSGVAEEITIQQVQDTVGELMNTVAGQVLSEIVPEDQRFAFSLPTVSDADPTTLRGTIYYFVTDEEQPVYFSVQHG